MEKVFKMHNNKALLQRLETQIERLTQQINQCPNDKAAEQLFDQQLFHPSGATKGQIPNLHNHLNEIIKNVDYLKQMVNHAQSEQVSYLTDKITNQIVAIHRELATQKLRFTQPVKQQETLYETHCRYLEYQRRLINMKQELELKLPLTSAMNKRHEIAQQIAVLEGRLYRCNHAIAKLERQLESDIVT